SLLLFCCHQTEELARLFVVVVVIFAEVPPFDVAIYLLNRLVMLGLFLPDAIAVGFIVEGGTLIAIDSHLTVAVVGVIASLHTLGLIYGDLMVVYSQAVALCIAVGE